MFQDLLHFQSLACTDAVAYSGAPDYSLSDPNGNVFCAFTKQTATNKARSNKDGEWADFTGTTTITVCSHIRVTRMLRNCGSIARRGELD
jgi:hypothetical protein